MTPPPPLHDNTVVMYSIDDESIESNEAPLSVEGDEILDGDED